MQVFSEEYQPFYSIIPQSEFITIKKPPIKGRRLPMKAILKTNTIITQKKPQHNAEARPLLP